MKTSFVRSMMATAAVALVVFATGCAVGIPGGDGVSNGGGLGEKNFVYAFTRLSADLKNCFTAINCEIKS